MHITFIITFKSLSSNLLQCKKLHASRVEYFIFPAFVEVIFAPRTNTWPSFQGRILCSAFTYRVFAVGWPHEGLWWF